MRKENGFWPDSVEKPRKYSADDFIGYFKDFFTNGVLGKDVTKLKVYANNDMSVKITAGTAYLNGRWFSPKSPVSITLKASDVTYSRIDLICIRCDYAQKNIYLYVVPGIPSQNPEIPEITRDEFYFDLGIAAVTIPANATVITQAEIKDLRFDGKYCGQVTSTIKSIDTTDLFAQYEAQWELLKAACAQDEEAVIKAWDSLNTVKKVNGVDPVDGNVSLNLDDIPDSEVFYKQNYSVQRGYATTENVKFITPFAEVPTVIVSGASKGGTSSYAGVTNATEDGFTIVKNGFTSVNWAAFGKPGNTAMVRSFKMLGRSTQDGTPTPEAPVDIVSVGDDGSTTVVACGKNLLSPDSIAIGGFDASNGAEITSLQRMRTGFLPAVTLRITFPQPTKILSIYQYDSNKKFLGASDVWLDTTSWGINDFIDNCKYIRLLLSLTDHTAVIDNDTLNIYKNGTMVEKDIGVTSTFEPYKATTAEITTGLPLCSIPVVSGGNYTDSNGQQWVCDELIYNADGTGKIIKRTRQTLLSSQYNWTMSANPTRYGYAAGITGADISLGYASAISEFFSDCRLYSTWIDIFTDYFESLDEFKAFLDANEVYVYYPLATPEEIELSAEEMNQLWDLYTYRNAPCVINDEGAPMEEVTIYA